MNTGMPNKYKKSDINLHHEKTIKIIKNRSPELRKQKEEEPRVGTYFSR